MRRHLKLMPPRTSWTILRSTEERRSTPSALRQHRNLGSVLVLCEMQRMQSSPCGEQRFPGSEIAAQAIGNPALARRSSGAQTSLLNFARKRSTAFRRCRRNSSRSRCGREDDSGFDRLITNGRSLSRGCWRSHLSCRLWYRLDLVGRLGVSVS